MAKEQTAKSDALLIGRTKYKGSNRYFHTIEHKGMVKIMNKNEIFSKWKRKLKGVKRPSRFVCIHLKLKMIAKITSCLPHARHSYGKFHTLIDLILQAVL